MTVHRPRTLDEARSLGGTPRAGGTDVSDRRRHGLVRGDLVDLNAIPGLDGIDVNAAGAAIGAMATLSRIAADPGLQERYGAFTAAAGSLATPQIRRMATLGGSLTQATRCWYARNGASCFRTGGEGCPARHGDHRFHSVFDLGPCVAVHPSTTAMTLLLYDAEVLIAGGDDRTVAAFLGDGSDPRRGDTLADGELVAGVRLPPNDLGERTAYLRATSRSLAEWPLVECAVRLRIVDGTIASAAVAVGAVAPVPLRLDGVAAALGGGPPTQERLREAAALATEGAEPLPGTRPKVDLLRRTVLATLLDAAGFPAEDHGS